MSAFNQWRLLCPHCKTSSTVRSSRELSDTVREATIQCDNPHCAHTWIAQVVAIRTIAPSMTPNPKVYIPLSTRSPAAQQPGGNQIELGMDYPNPRLAPSG